MSRENCFPHQDNLAAFSLGALDAMEAAALESHLATCADCVAELADYQTVATGLLHALPPQMPSANLRRKLASRLPSAQKRTSSLPAFSFNQFATVTLVAVLLGLNIFSVLQIRKLQAQQNALSERLAAEQSTIGMLAHPGTELVLITADLPEMTGSVLFDEQKNTAVLVLWNLPELEAEQTYQIWLINAQGERFSAGLFTPSNEQEYTTASVEASIPIGQFAAIGVTIEPQGGSEQPTSSPVLVVEL
jgi:anti-sigma-K factor RskA